MTVEVSSPEALRRDWTAHLVSVWLPALDGVRETLVLGARVAVAACGRGAATILMARAFPESRFYGFDAQATSIAEARRAATGEGVGDHVHFAVAAEDEYPGTGYDLVAHIDCLHHLLDPIRVAMHTHAALAPDGSWLLVVPLTAVTTAPDVEWGEAKVRDVARRAGFTWLARSARTSLHLVFEARA